MCHRHAGVLWVPVRWAGAASVVLLAACASTAPPPPTAAMREGFGVVAIAAAQFLPASNFSTFAKGAAAGAAKGAAISGCTMAGSTAIAAASVPPMAPVIVLSGVLATAAVAATGAVSGAAVAVPAETARQVDAAIHAAVANMDAHAALARQLRAVLQAEPWIQLVPDDVPGPSRPAAAPDYAALRASRTDTVLELAVTEIGFESCGPEFVRRLSSACPQDQGRRLVDLYLTVQARLVRVADGEQLFQRRFRYKSALREIPLWIAQDGRLLAEEFVHAYRELAERVRDEALLLTALELPAREKPGHFPRPDEPDSGLCWLVPVYPRVAPITVAEVLSAPLKKPGDVCPASGQHYAAVDSLRPTLRWSSFPRAVDQARLPRDVLQAIGSVSYDLKIWREEGCERGHLVYERSGLATPDHTLEQPLEPASRYFWSVRARFLLHGRPNSTPWSFHDLTTCFANDVADWQYLRFSTPP